MSTINKHECNEMPLYPRDWKVVMIAKYPHVHQDGSTFGEISWKLFEATDVPIFGLGWNHEGKTLDPPICPFCKIKLED